MATASSPVNISVFRSYGKDSLLLATLAYNVGSGTLMGNANHPKSRLIQKKAATAISTTTTSASAVIMGK